MLHDATCCSGFSEVWSFLLHLSAYSSHFLAKIFFSATNNECKNAEHCFGCAFTEAFRAFLSSGVSSFGRVVTTLGGSDLMLLAANQDGIISIGI